MRITQVCHPVLCDEDPHQQLVGGKATWFCCKKGFFKSLGEFAEYYANKYNCHVCNDKLTVKIKGEVERIPCPAGCYLKSEINA
jgi:hypothetical protein